MNRDRTSKGSIRGDVAGCKLGLLGHHRSASVKDVCIALGRAPTVGRADNGVIPIDRDGVTEVIESLFVARVKLGLLCPAGTSRHVHVGGSWVESSMTGADDSVVATDRNGASELF